MKIKSTSAALALTLGLAASANAAIVTINSISYTGTAPELGGNNLDDENQLINGSGLSAVLTDANLSTVTHGNVVFSSPGNAWVTTDPGGASSDFFASSPGSVVFDIVFDATYTVDNLASWGYHFGALNGNDMSVITLDYGVGNFTDGSIANQTIAQGASAGASVITALGGITADRVRITVTDNYSGTSAGGDRVGLAEIAFQGTVVPEPSSTALLGLGGLALILRRRK